MAATTLPIRRLASPPGTRSRSCLIFRVDRRRRPLVSKDWPEWLSNIEDVRQARRRLVGWRIHLSTTAERLARAPYAAALLLDPIFWGRNVVRGDGHSVLYLPGYGGWGRNDLHSLPLRNWLRRIGYQPVQSDSPGFF